MISSEADFLSGFKFVKLNTRMKDFEVNWLNESKLVQQNINSANEFP